MSPDPLLDLVQAAAKGYWALPLLAALLKPVWAFTSGVALVIESGFEGLDVRVRRRFQLPPRT